VHLRNCAVNNGLPVSFIGILSPDFSVISGVSSERPRIWNVAALSRTSRHFCLQEVADRLMHGAVISITLFIQRVGASIYLCPPRSVLVAGALALFARVANLPTSCTIFVLISMCRVPVVVFIPILVSIMRMIGLFCLILVCLEVASPLIPLSFGV
jgi:hypothetical protein